MRNFIKCWEAFDDRLEQRHPVLYRILIYVSGAILLALTALLFILFVLVLESLGWYN